MRESDDVRCPPRRFEQMPIMLWEDVVLCSLYRWLRPMRICAGKWRRASDYTSFIISHWPQHRPLSLPFSWSSWKFSTAAQPIDWGISTSRSTAVKVSGATGSDAVGLANEADAQATRPAYVRIMYSVGIVCIQACAPCSLPTLVSRI